jgi:Bacterial SH3 domain
MRRYLVAVCCALLATNVAAEPSALSGDAIKETVAGAVLEVDTPVGVKVPIRYFEDGRIAGEARGLAYILGAPSDTGKWWVSSDRLCHKWSKWFDGVLQCMRLSQDGSRIFWRRDDGETGTAVISTPPTPPRLIAAAPKSPDVSSRREAAEAKGSFSASMAAMTVFPSRANHAAATSSSNAVPEMQKQPDLGRRAEASPILPADKATPAGAPKETASVEPSRANPSRAVQSFRVRGVASDDVLNVRAGPSTDYSATATLLPDTVGVRIVGQCLEEWCPIAHRGITGWVNSIYLAEDTRIGGSDRYRRGSSDYRQ